MNSLPRIPLSTCALTLLLGALSTTTIAQTPLEDLGFDAVTDPSDLDLVVVRERSYGAVGIDLSAYGIAGTHDYVQSIYVRAYHGTTNTRRVMRGRLRFPNGVSILGVIFDKTDLGGDVDDGILTASDADFAIGSTPDDYSARLRGFEGVIPEQEHACVRPNNTVDFYLLERTDDLDDFRVIIDYGSSFPVDAALDIELVWDPGSPYEQSEIGIRIGDVNGAVTGSGDFGETLGLNDVPLIGSAAPSDNQGFPVDLTDTFLMTRGGEFLDVYDPDEQMLLTAARETGWRDLSRGPYGYVYAGQLNFGGYVVVDSVGGGMGWVPVAGFPGNPEVVSDLPEPNQIALIRHRSGVNSVLDVYIVDVVSATIVRSFEIPQGDLTGPLGAVSAGSKLYVLDSNQRLAEIDPVTGSYTTIDLMPSGRYMNLEVDAAHTEIYLMRRAVDPNYDIDHVDLATRNVTLSVATTDELRLGNGITRDSQGTVWLLSRAWSGPRNPTMVGFDPSTWTHVQTIHCAGNRSSGGLLSDVDPRPVGTRYCAPAVLNSRDDSTWIAAWGSPVATDNDLWLTSFAMPSGAFGYFINSMATGFVPNAGGSQGTLCLGGSVGRHDAQVQSSGSHRSIRVNIDLTSVPQPTGAVAVTVGQTWYFQCWHRDAVGGTATSNFSDAISIQFQ